MRRHFTISNLLSVSRIFLVFPMGYCLVSDFPYHRWWTAGIIIIAIATDFLDGFLARKLHQVTEMGKIIDPVADKVGIGAYAILLAWTGNIPVWFVVLVLVRDLLIFSGGVYIQQKKKIIPQSNWPGKISVTFIAAVFLLGTIQVEALHTALTYTIWTSVLMIAWSVFSYAQRLFIGRHVELTG